MRTAFLLPTCLAIFLCVPTWADEGPPDPISIDRESPSILDFSIAMPPIPGVPGFGYHTPGIYDMPTTSPLPPVLPRGLDVGMVPGPVVHVQDVNYGLQNAPNNEDNNDAHSNGEQLDLNPDDPFEANSPDVLQILYFSGDDLSLGILGSDYENQSRLGQAAGDRFMANGVTTLSPRQSLMTGQPANLLGPLFPGGANNSPQNLLSANQHRYHEIPSIGPAMKNTYQPQSPRASRMDDLDALELTPFDLTPQDQRLVHNTPIYFSLDPQSPSLMGNFLPADILVSPPTVPGFHLFAPHVTMGLAPGDNLDALAVWDYEQPLFADPKIDVALFSLAPGSPTLLGPDLQPGTVDDYSAADVFVSDFSGFSSVFLQAKTIGMKFTDNVDALDVEPEWLRQEPLDFVSALPIADSDGDGDVDGRDFLAWQRGFGKLGPGLTLADGDFNLDDVVVDGIDLAVWQSQYGTAPIVAASVEIPEPSLAGLLSIGLTLWATTMRKR